METMYVGILLLTLLLVSVLLFDRVRTKRQVLGLENDLSEIKRYCVERNLREINGGNLRIKWRSEQNISATILAGSTHFQIRVLDLSKDGLLIESKEIQLENKKTYHVDFNGLENERIIAKVEVVRVAGVVNQFGCIFKELPLTVRTQISRLVEVQARQDILSEIKPSS